MPSSQRPFFLSSFLAAFRQQTPPALSATSQPNKHTTQPTSSSPTTGSRAMSSASHPHSQSQSSQQSQQRTGGVMNQLPLQSQPHRHPHHSAQAHRPSMPIPGSGRRRGSDSSSEGFRDVLGADKWYIGGRTAGGEERFFKLGVVKRVRSKDRLSLDRLSL
ncbi:hypothetical protein GGR54DRAFT_534692 [Hypoxylon sp. NC1633]|nr:hypothetical protein GGR54DRAFT_534692 [Hypoxylon sp. NC1633]